MAHGKVNNEREKGMATIRAIVAEKQQQRGHSADESTIKEKVRRHLVEVCKLLPDDTPVGREFANVMFDLQDRLSHEEAVKTLIEKAMNERDDLQDYPFLRQELVLKIKG